MGPCVNAPITVNGSRLETDPTEPPPTASRYCTCSRNAGNNTRLP